MIVIRNYREADAEAIDKLAVNAFSEYRERYENWPEFSVRLGNFSSLSSQAQIIIAMIEQEVVGAVGYVAASIKKAEHFPENTPLI